MKVTKNRYLLSFAVAVVVLSGVRMFLHPSMDWRDKVEESTAADEPSAVPVESIDAEDSHLTDIKKHRIRGVVSYTREFPDSNDVQLIAANRWGVTPVKNRADAEQRKKELVYICSNPYYHVDPLNSSIPYLVPRAAVLLQDIGRAFYDSLYVKGVPFHQLIVTSVLRSQADVQRLRRYNTNATENSCHLYGTTFDICYNRYKTVEDPDGPARRMVRNDTLKWVLSEVLRDMHNQQRCYIKYEVKQGCFHLTVR